jgi:hypothetical protein
LQSRLPGWQRGGAGARFWCWPLRAPRSRRARIRRRGAGRGAKRQRAQRPRWQGQWREAKGFRCYLVDDDRLVHLRSWPQIQSQEELVAALQQVQGAGLISEEEVRLCVIADGAPWIWHGVAQLFPTAQEILDSYPCSQPIPAVAELQYGTGAAAALEWGEATMARLFAGEVEGGIWGLQRIRPATAAAAAAIDKLIRDLREHSHRINSGTQRKGGYPLGSGGIEAAHKFMCHARLKRSGAWGYVANSNHMLALRCAKYNGTFDRVFERYRQPLLAKSQQQNVKK